MCWEGLEGVTGLTIGLGRSTPGETESSSTRLRILFLLGIGGEELGPGAFEPGWSSLGFSDVVSAGNGGAGDGGLGPDVPVTLAWFEILSSCPAGCWTVVEPPGPVVVVVVVVVLALLVTQADRRAVVNSPSWLLLPHCLFSDRYTILVVHYLIAFRRAAAHFGAG